MDIDVCWGGYYAYVSEDDGLFGVFRLLDFNSDAYHIALYTEKFQNLPTFEDVKNLRSFIGHAPMDARGLLRRQKPELIGATLLTDDDLSGYAVYLDAHEVDEKALDTLMTTVKEFSSRGPVCLTLELVADELQVTQCQ